MTTDEEAAACKVAMPHIEVIEKVINELRKEDWYRTSTDLSDRMKQ